MRRDIKNSLEKVLPDNIENQFLLDLEPEKNILELIRML